MAEEAGREVRVGSAQEKRELLARLLEKKAARPKTFPLSFAQQRLWFLDRLSPGSPAYNISAALPALPSLTPALLESILREVVRRHATLRTTFGEAEGQPVQIVAPAGSPACRTVDLRALPEERMNGEILRLAQQEIHFPFDLSTGPLLRATLFLKTADASVVLVVVHHIVADGWSVGLLLDELVTLYAAVIAGSPPALPALPVQYADFAQSQRAWLEGEVLESQTAYWRERLAGIPPLDLPTDRPRPAIQGDRGGGVPFRLSRETADRLRDLSRQAGATLYMALLAGFAAFLHRYSGQELLAVGSPVAGRNRPELEKLIGLFANMLVLRADSAGDPAFRDSLDRIRETTLGALAHQEMPFEKLVEVLQPERHPGRTPLFQAAFVFQNTPDRDDDSQMLSDLSRENAKFDLTLEVAEQAGGLEGVLEFHRDLFDGGTAERMARHLKALFESAAGVPGRRLSGLELLASEERAQILARGRAAEPATGGGRLLHELFEEQAARAPAALAVTAEDGSLSYGELDARAGRLAAVLRQRGVGPDQVVGLLAGRSAELIAGLLGILKAGGAYLPLDPDQPAGRLAYLLADSGARLVVAQEALLDRLPAVDGGAAVVPLAASLAAGAGNGAPDAGPPARPDPAALAYVIYTSGSTGRPKGSLLPHANAVRLLTATRSWFGFGPGDVWTLFHSPAFDFSVWEIWGALAFGGRLVVVPHAVSRSPEAFLDLLRRERVTVLNQTPSAFRQLARVATAEEPGTGGYRGLALREVIFGGEALEPAALASWIDRFGDGLPRLVNMYGITETTVHVTYRPLAAADLGRPDRSPLGRPIPDLALHVVDRWLEPAPPGVAGELAVGGAGLARGYLGRPDLTAARFVPDPLSGVPGARLYRSGDLARRLADGEIVYAGRIDHQVKIRGYRIELGEIEAALREHPEVAEAVVALREPAPGDLRLVAYAVPRPGANPAPRALREHLQGRLPDSMVPAAFVLLDALPLTPNGKLDRKALPAPDDGATAAATVYAEPRTPLERTLATVWQAVLGVARVGLGDNFFDLGGHSLLLLEVQSRLNAGGALERPVSVVELFQYPTVASLAAFLDRGRHDEAGVAQASRRGAERGGVAARAGGTDGTAGAGIAVIGMAGRFPRADSVAELWENLRQGVEAIGPLADEELRAAGVPAAHLESPHYVKAAARLAGIDLFDADFFGFSPREAEVLDPQHRLFLEHAWQALEDAGYDPRNAGGPVGVYAGAQMSSYAFGLFTRPEILEAIGPMALQTSIDKDFLATRTSYKLGLKGPSIAVQSACSTSLVAVHLACQALLLGECDLALAGGVAVRVPQDAGYLYVEGDIQSPDGHCRAFDARARGTVGSSGVGVVVLKRLEDARRDGDTLRAVIRGTAVNNDGDVKVGYTAPSVEGQAEVIAAAQAAAGVEPASVTYVEAHGTGTVLGDPIEVAALGRAFRAGGAAPAPGSCALGSIKTNLGHMDTAAGVGGLIKTVLALEHRQIPPSLHFESPNPKIDFAGGPFYVNTRLADWPAGPGGAPRRAGVSSFGIGGTNAHAVLEEAPAPELSGPSRPWQLLVLSARTAAALDEATAALATFLERRPDLSAAGLADVAHTLRRGRHPFDHRRALVCRDAGEAAAALAAGAGPRLPTRHRDHRAAGRRAVVFLYPGQGSQHPGMGRELYDGEPRFREEIDRCAEILAPRLGRDLRRLLYPGPETAPEAAAAELRETRFAQPALFAVEHALTALWESWGVMPAAMLGHSLGEFVAACRAGVMGLEDALELVAARGELMQEMPPGAMLSVELSEADLAAWIGREEETGLALAAVNAPALCTVAGPEEAVAGLEARLRAADVSCRRVHTSHAFHSALMEPARTRFAERAGRLALRPPTLPYLSNLTGDWIQPGQATDPAYWGEHLRRPVRFAAGLARLLADGGEAPVLLEVGPGRTLGELARRQPGRVPTVASLGHPRDPEPEGAALLRALGRLWAEGVEIDWQGFQGGERRHRVPLPTYPFQRKRFWIEPAFRAAAGPAVPVPSTADEPAANAPAPVPAGLAAHARPDLDTPYVEPRTATERRLAEIWQSLLGIGPVGAHDDFFELGGHSLLATRLLSRIRDAFGRELDLASVFAGPTVEQLAARVEAGGERTDGSPPPLARAGRGGDLPLSFAQQRLLFLDVLAPGDLSYNLPLILRLDGRLRAAALAAALAALVERHEVLRTTFRVVKGKASQIVHPAAESGFAGLPQVDLAGLPAAAGVEAEARRVCAQEVHRPFDLFRGPVVRALLVRLRPDSHVLVITAHHIAADGWSWGVVIREVVELYEAAAEGRPAALPALPFQYADFAAWQRGWLDGEILERQVAYWRERLAALPRLELRTDRPRPPVRSGRGAAAPLALPAGLTEALRRLARQEDATMFMTLLAGFLLLLHHYSDGGEDLVVGTDVANRTRAETEGIVGLFVNQLVLRTDLSGDPQFREVLARVRRVTLEAYAHQDAPFDRLVETLNPARDMSRTPLFQVKVVLQNTPLEARALREISVAPFGQAAEVAKFDLLLNLFEVGPAVTGNLEYSTDLFEPPTIARLLSQLQTVLERVAERPDLSLSEVRAVLQDEDRQAEAARAEAERAARGRTFERVRRRTIELPVIPGST